MEEIKSNIIAAHEVYINYPFVWKEKIYEFYKDVWKRVYKEYGEKYNWRIPNIYEFMYNKVWYKDKYCMEERVKNEVLEKMDVYKFGIAFAKELKKNSSICVSLENWNGDLYFYVWIMKNYKQICPKKCKDILGLKVSKEFSVLYEEINQLHFFYKNNIPSFKLFEDKKKENIIENMKNEMVKILKLVDNNLEKIKELL